MRRRERFGGADAPFEGDRTVWLRAIPADARVTAATLTVTPISAPGATPFGETVDLAPGPGSWGATQSGGSAGLLHWVELDFHARRTLARVIGPALTGAAVQVDLGGVYAQVNDRGAVLVPNGGVPELTLGSSGDVPSLTASRVKLTGASAFTVDRVVVRSTPSNLQARLGTGLPFWARPGELTRPETTPDFATALVEALATAEVEHGFYRVPLVVHSDSIARLDIEVVVDFLLERAALPGGLAETTLTYDRSGAAAGAAGPARLAVRVPAGGRVVASPVRPRAVGAFEKSRVAYGPVGPVAVAGVLPLVPGAPLARPVTLPANLAVTSLDLLLSVSTPAATLHIDLLDDADGKPSSRPLLPRPLVVTLDRDLHAAATWVEASLPAEFQIMAGRRYWVVVQSLAGEAAWSVAPSPTASTAGPGIQQSTDASLSWRAASVAASVAGAGTNGVAAAGGVEGLLRLRTVPPTFTMPLTLQVGDGPLAERVSLARFEPLGRVDLDLGGPEVTGALNRYLSAAEGSTPTPRGEQLRNGGFESWRRTADLPTGSRAMPVPFQPRRIVMTGPCRALAVAEHDAKNLSVAAIAVFDETAGDPVEVEEGGGVLDVAGGRHGEAYVLGNAAVMAVAADGTARRRRLVSGVRALAVSPDGETLHVAVATSNPTGGTGEGTAASASVGLVLSFPTAAIDDPSVPASFLSLGDWMPSGLVADPDGVRLHVLGEEGGLRTVDLNRRALLDGGIPTPAGLVRPAVTADGTTLVAVDPEAGRVVVVALGDGRISVLDLAEGHTAARPSAVAVSADSTYAFVALRGADSIAVVDLRSHTVVHRRRVGHDPADLALTADGDRLYVADTPDDPKSSVITVVAIGTLVPEDWVVTAGRVRAACAPSRRGYAAVVGAAPGTGPTATAGLGQTVGVVAGCAYELGFLASASGGGASTVVSWSGEGGVVLRQDESAIDVPPAVGGEPVVPVPEPHPHRVVLVAPQGATEAQVSIVAVPGVVAQVGHISLVATADLVANGALGLTGDGALTGWEVRPPNPSGLVATAVAGALRIANGGADPVVLSQVVAADAGVTYRLSVEAGATAAESRAELAWRSATGEPVGSVARVVLSPSGPALLAADAVAPANTVAAELRITVPARAAVELRSVGVAAVRMTDVALSFVAHSVGELTLSAWTVAVDVDEAAARPPVPAGGLSLPRPPATVPGEAHDSYCATCEGEHGTTEDAGVACCANCGARVLLPGRTGAAAAAGAVLHVRRP